MAVLLLIRLIVRGGLVLTVGLSLCLLSSIGFAIISGPRPTNVPFVYSSHAHEVGTTVVCPCLGLIRLALSKHPPSAWSVLVLRLVVLPSLTLLLVGLLLLHLLVGINVVGSLSQPEPIPRVGIGLDEYTTFSGNVPLAIKEKIWQGAYIDLLLLLQDRAAAVLARSDTAPELTLAAEGKHGSVPGTSKSH